LSKGLFCGGDVMGEPGRGGTGKPRPESTQKEKQ